jgi:hypothetical protein
MLTWNVGHQGDIILYFGSPKKIRCQSDMWDQHDIFIPRKQKNNRWVHADWTISFSSMTNFIERHKGFIHP